MTNFTHLSFLLYLIFINFGVIDHSFSFCNPLLLTPLHLLLPSPDVSLSLSLPPSLLIVTQELIKHTSPLHPDYPALKDAHASIDRVAVHINEALRRQQNQADLMALQAQFSHSIALVKPGRVLVYQGPSVKRGRRGDVLYHFMLFNDTLCYATASRTGRLSMHRELTIDK